MQQMIDLVMEDQRQSRDAKHQHEHGADDAGPLVGPAPSAQ
jgi:hypothetical protein